MRDTKPPGIPTHEAPRPDLGIETGFESNPETSTPPPVQPGFNLPEIEQRFQEGRVDEVLQTMAAPLGNPQLTSEMP